MLSMARLGTHDLAKAGIFYDGLAAVLGAARIHTGDKAISYRGGRGGIFVIGLPLEGEANVGNGTQISFATGSRSIVDQAYARALELGGSPISAPAGHGPNADAFYAAYVRDPDGNKLMLYHAG